MSLHRIGRFAFQSIRNSGLCYVRERSIFCIQGSGVPRRTLFFNFNSKKTNDDSEIEGKTKTKEEVMKIISENPMLREKVLAFRSSLEKCGVPVDGSMSMGMLSSSKLIMQLSRNPQLITELQNLMTEFQKAGLSMNDMKAFAETMSMSMKQ